MALGLLEFEQLEELDGMQLSPEITTHDRKYDKYE